MATTCYRLDQSGRLQSDLPWENAVRAKDSSDGLVWIDFLQPTEDDRELFRELGLHQVAIDLCVESGPHPVRFERFKDHVFLLLHGVDYESESAVVETTDLAMFIGANFLVTSHRAPMLSLAAVRRRLEAVPEEFTTQADLLAYRLTDALTDNVMPTVDALRDVAEELETEIVDDPQQGHIESILDLKRSTLRLGRIMGPQRLTLERLAGGEGSEIGEEAGLGFRHIRDQVGLIEAMLSTTRERADSAMATYLSAVAIKQNESVRTLTIVAFVFLPLTLLVGIYGMNFENMPELQTHFGYFVVLGFIVAALVGLTLWIAASRLRSIGENAAARARHHLQVDRRRLVGYIEELGHVATTPARIDVKGLANRRRRRRDRK